ncbi:hypothetical protein B0H11DRAFT_1911282 [Mycena galericulata]|nr:hypothetical protein B0H11DRAFT_1911282 [Mycena galericulata]
MPENENSSEPDYPILTDPSDYPEEETDEEEEEEESGPFGSDRDGVTKQIFKALYPNKSRATSPAPAMERPTGWDKERRQQLRYSNTFDRVLLRGPEEQLEAQRLVDRLVEGEWDVGDNITPAARHRIELVKERYLKLYKSGAWTGKEAWEVDGLMDRMTDTLSWLIDNSLASRDPSKRIFTSAITTAERPTASREYGKLHRGASAMDWAAKTVPKLIFTSWKHTEYLINFFDLDKSASERLLYGLPEVVVLINAAWSPAGRDPAAHFALDPLLAERSKTLLCSFYPPLPQGLYKILATGLRLMVDLIAFKNHHKPGDQLTVTLQFDSGQDEAMARFDIVYVFVGLALVRGAFKNKLYRSFSHVLNGLPGEQRHTNIEWDDDWKNRPVFSASGPRGASMEADRPLNADAAREYLHRKQLLSGLAPRSSVALDTYAVLTPSMDLTAGLLYGESQMSFSAVPSVNPALFKVEAFKPTFLTRPEAIARSPHLATVHRLYVEWSLLACAPTDLVSMEDLPPHLTDSDLLPQKFLDKLSTALVEGKGQLSAVAEIHEFLTRSFKRVLQETRKTAAEQELAEKSLNQELMAEQVSERQELKQVEFDVVLRGGPDKECDAIALQVETPSREDVFVAGALDNGDDGMWAGSTVLALDMGRPETCRHCADLCLEDTDEFDRLKVWQAWRRAEKLTRHENSSAHWYDIVKKEELQRQIEELKLDSLTRAISYESCRDELAEGGERRLKTRTLSQESVIAVVLQDLTDGLSAREDDFIAEPYKGYRQCPRCARLWPSSGKLERHMRTHTTRPLLETVLPTGDGVGDNLWINPIPFAPLLLDSEAPLLLDSLILRGDPPIILYITDIDAVSDSQKYKTARPPWFAEVTSAQLGRVNKEIWNANASSGSGSRRGTANKPRGGAPSSADRGGAPITVARGGPPSKGPAVRAAATSRGAPESVSASEAPTTDRERSRSTVSMRTAATSASEDVDEATRGAASRSPSAHRERAQSNASMHTASEDVDGRPQEAATKKGGQKAGVFGTTAISATTKEALESVLAGSTLMGTPTMQVPNYLQGLATNYQGRVANFCLLEAGVNFQRASTEVEMLRMKYAEICIQAEVNGLTPPEPPTVWQLSAGARESLTSALGGLVSEKGRLRETHPEERTLQAITLAEYVPRQDKGKGKASVFEEIVFENPVSYDDYADNEDLYVDDAGGGYNDGEET